MQPLDLVSAAPWQRAIFTTYALSLSFFEAVVLDRLVRGGGRNALILADPEGIRFGLSEQGACRAGREYELEPVACGTGAFHPKISALLAADDAHLLIGSGNLTFGGWGMNLETIEHLHPSFAAEAFDDVADMFELMNIADHIRCGVSDEFDAIAAHLRLAATSSPRSGNFRVLHSVGGSIADQLISFADDLGGATRLTVASPYFDNNGGALLRLAQRLGCDDIRLHVHPGSAVRGVMGANWPDPMPGNPVCITAPFDDKDRRLHAKCFEVMCRRGRLVLSGSANATSAGLERGNVEASLLRIQRNAMVGWMSQPAVAPPILPLPVLDEGIDQDETRIGVLRAVLEGERVSGQILVPALRGAAKLGVATAAGIHDLGPIIIDEAGRFEAQAPGLELRSWSGGRMVLRIDQDGRAAEGFVSVAAAAMIVRKAGALAPRLLAMLTGTETPVDVAAILSWFREDPSRMMSGSPRGGGASQAKGREAVWVPVEQLQAAGTFSSTSTNSGGGSEPSWNRALSLVRSAFSEPRGPWNSGTPQDDQGEDEGEQESEEERRQRLQRFEAAKKCAIRALDDLLNEMLADRHKGKYASAAFELAHYLVDRTRPAPERARVWLDRTLAGFSTLDPNTDAGAITAALLAKATDRQDNPAERARRFLLLHRIDPIAFAANAEAVTGYIEVLQPGWDPGSFIAEVRAARTPSEEVRAYFVAAETGGDLAGLKVLQASSHWPKLARGLGDSMLRATFLIVEQPVTACPKCRQSLPTAAREELRQTGVTSHCRLILWKGQ